MNIDLINKISNKSIFNFQNYQKTHFRYLKALVLKLNILLKTNYFYL